MNSVLVVATSKQTRGGITSVINAYAQSSHWENWHCRWLTTHIDASKWKEIVVFFKAIGTYFFILPNYAIVHFHLSEPPSALRKLFFIYPAKWFGKKCVVHLHSFSPDTSFDSKHQWIYKMVFRLADQIIVLSPYWKLALEKSFGDQLPVTVVLNPSSFPVQNGGYERKPIILFAGILNNRKGYKDVIQAFAKLHQELPEWQLLLAGNGEIAEAEALAASLGIGDKAICVGWVEKLFKEKLFNEASVFCLPSYAEGFSMAVIDAMAHNIPVITTPVGGITDIFKNGESIMLHEPGDIDQLAQHMRTMMHYKTLRSAISKQAYAIMEENFAIEKVTAQMDGIYTALVQPESEKPMQFVPVLGYNVYSDSLAKIPIDAGRIKVINTISPNSYGLSLKNRVFEKALKASDYLVLDGVYFALASIFMHGKNIKKNQGPDVFDHFMHRLNEDGGTAFFLGSTNKTLKRIKSRAAIEFPKVQIHSYSPPFKTVFSEADDENMHKRINVATPDILFVGMTCPKQECWSIKNKSFIQAKLIVNIGNVFDWYAGTQPTVHPIWFKLRLGWLARIAVRPEIFARNIGNQMLFFKDTFQKMFSRKKKADYSFR